MSLLIGLSINQFELQMKKIDVLINHSIEVNTKNIQVVIYTIIYFLSSYLFLILLFMLFYTYSITTNIKNCIQGLNSSFDNGLEILTNFTLFIYSFFIITLSIRFHCLNKRIWNFVIFCEMLTRSYRGFIYNAYLWVICF